jgi:hypothetical protein
MFGVEASKAVIPCHQSTTMLYERYLLLIAIAIAALLHGSPCKVKTSLN